MPIFDDVRRVLFLHAHPDDETLATGVLIAWLVDAGVDVAVVTATRGERGDVVDGPLRVLAGTDALVPLRERELDGALTALGVRTHAFLGTPPARAAGLPPRRYLDSGMRWVTPTLAGPAESAGPDALTSADVTEAAADLAAFVDSYAPDLLVTYDLAGGYGHPDHVACHHIGRSLNDARSPSEERSLSLTKGGPLSEGGRESGRSWSEERSLSLTKGRPLSDDGRESERSLSLTKGRPVPPRLVEVVSEPLLAQATDAELFDLTGYLETAKSALRCHASQLTVDGDDVVHSGGQRQPIVTRLALRQATTVVE